jgi:hypothetical protein
MFTNPIHLDVKPPTERSEFNVEHWLETMWTRSRLFGDVVQVLSLSALAIMHSLTAFTKRSPDSPYGLH